MLWTTCAPNLFSQPLAFRRFDDRDGLLQSQIYSILEDKEGFLWVGSDEGVSRLGASGTSNYGSPQGLQARMINDIKQDREGTIWVAGLVGGVSSIRGRVVANYGKAEGLENATVFCLLERRDGTLLAGTRRGLFQKKAARFERIEFPEGWTTHGFTSLLEDAQGHLWMGTLTGKLALWDGASLKPAALPETVTGRPIHSLCMDAQGVVWALSTKGLVRKSGSGNWEIEILPGLSPYAHLERMSLSDRGELLMAAGGDGLFIRSAKGQIQHLNDRDGFWKEGILAVHRDSQGVLWTGTERGYLMAQVVPGLRNLSVDPRTGVGLGLNAVVCFLELEPGKVMMGGTGLHLWEEGKGITERWTQIGNQGPLFAWAMVKTPDGTIWIGSTQGLLRLKKGKLELLAGPLKDQFVASLLVHQDRIWAGTETGTLVELGLDGKVIAQHRLPESGDLDVLLKLLPRPWGVLVGGRLGVYHFRKGIFYRRLADGPLVKTAISTLFDDAANRLWVATSDGVYGFTSLGGDDYDEHVLHLGTLEAGLQGSTNWICRLPSGELAMGHNRGISFFKDGQSRFLTQTLGLVSNETSTDSVMLDSQKRLWVGMVGGASILDTREALPPQNPPPPRVVEVRYGRFSAWLPDKLKLPPRVGLIEFFFDVPMPTVPFAPKYQTWIEGMDKSWQGVALHSNTLQVAALAPGKYTFKVRASFDGHNWVEGPALPFSIEPAIYQHWLFRILMILTGAGLVAVLVKYRMVRLEKKAFLLEGHVKARTHELEARNRSMERLHHQLKNALESRMQLVRTVSHDIRSPLSSIMISTERLRDGVGDGDRLDAILNILDREARRMESIVRGLLDGARAEFNSDTLNMRVCHPTEILEGLTDTLALKAEARELKTSLQMGPELEAVWILADTAAMQQVLFNLIENALKFTEPPNGVGIRAFVQDKDFVLEVWDSGRGMDESTLEHLFEPFTQARKGDAEKGWGLGLNICRTMVDAHRGRIEVKSDLGRGSNFKVILPLVL